MKRNLLGAVVVVLAIGSSAYNKLAITENFLVQSSANVFTRTVTANLSCITPATLFCHYEVTTAGKLNIPAKASYTPTDINTYLTNAWIVAPPGDNRRLYAI